MPDLSELMYISVATQQLAEYAERHSAGDVLTYFLNMAAKQADWQYSLALRLSEVQFALIDSAGPAQEPASAGNPELRDDCS